MQDSQSISRGSDCNGSGDVDCGSVGRRDCSLCKARRRDIDATESTCSHNMIRSSEDPIQIVTVTLST